MQGIAPQTAILRNIPTAPAKTEWQTSVQSFGYASKSYAIRTFLGIAVLQRHDLRLLKEFVESMQKGGEVWVWNEGGGLGFVWGWEKGRGGCDTVA